ncbi:hypothetical protein NML43_01975 [Rhodopseudomonas palustris]|uniref:hypothetical protein n=1 Tax=Rhodopseudomonas palustris TaxID=1076 RepID=UPI0020CD232F|nr:hypothetical protein [Rhodopseudomonas palustris]MCP9625849.1 hypothetical protein [Rhodopseudomonas palustris]
MNHIIIDAMHLTRSPMLESVVGTLDPRQKIEMLKARADQIRQKDWKKAIKNHADRLERVARIRNAICHAPLIPAKVKGRFEFAPVAVTKILKSVTIVDSKNYNLERLTIERVKEIILLAEKTLAGGEEIRGNFGKIRAAMAAKGRGSPDLG